MRPLTEYDPYDLEFTFWRERLSIDDDGYYIITMLFNDFDLIEAPKNVEFSMIVSNHINSRSIPIGVWYRDYYNYCDDSSHGVPYDIPENNEIQTPLYFLWYIAYRDMRYPFDFLHIDNSSHLVIISEKIADLSSNVMLTRSKDDYCGESWSSCDPYYVDDQLVPDHQSIFITERIESYDFSHNMYLELIDEHGVDRGLALPPAPYIYYLYSQSRTIIPSPIFLDRRLDFYMYDGSSHYIKSFCYCYSPGDAVTKYLYYSYIGCISKCPASWKDMNYKPILHAFGVGDPPFLVYIGFPAIGDEIIYPSDCIYYYYRDGFYFEDFSYLSTVSFHAAIFDPTIVKTDNILWGV